MFRYIFSCGLLCLVLCQCDTMKQDCRAVAVREAEIAKESVGDYYIGRRYYIPATRFWGYIRRPGASWSTAKLVIMDESIVRNPDRGFEPPVKGAVFGTDDNVEYVLRGKYTDEKAYDPSTDLILPVFKPSSFAVRNKKPGFLFVPSEERSDDYVTLLPAIMPKPEQCSAYSAR